MELDGLTYDLRAFVSAARSIAAYVHKDAKAKGVNALQKYDGLASRDPALKFFRDVRNVNLHAGPVHPRKGVKPLRIHAVTVVKKPDGTELRSPPSNVVTVNVITYTLDDWPGPSEGEVIEACESYLTGLKRLVDDAVSAGITARGMTQEPSDHGA